MWASLAATLHQCIPWQEPVSVTFHCFLAPSSAARVTFGTPPTSLKHSLVSFLQTTIIYMLGDLHISWEMTEVVFLIPLGCAGCTY